MMMEVRQKLVIFIDDDGAMAAGWMTVPTLADMERDGRLIRTDLSATQAATVIDAATKKLGKCNDQ